MSENKALLAPIHGSDIYSASQHYAIAVDEWIDLSTGINPRAYPVDVIDTAAFQRLPYLSPKLLDAARQYYGHHPCLAVAGIQSVIQSLLGCLSHKTLLVPDLGYSEYRQQWLAQGGEIVYYPAMDEAAAIAAIDELLVINPDCHLLVINPNNPSGVSCDSGRLHCWAEKLAPCCRLIIDEAFVDMPPEKSVLAGQLQPNMMVLRSFGKFFGLAGIRLGFVFADQAVLAYLRREQGLWSINGPAQALAVQALTDRAWQQQARRELTVNQQYIQQLCAPLFAELPPIDLSQCGLFCSYYLPADQAQMIYQGFACRGILLRLITIDAQSNLLRIGLLDHRDVLATERIKSAVRAMLREGFKGVSSPACAASPLP